MINIASLTQLDIMTTSTNKAIEKALSSATPKEFATLSQGKDLKSVLTTLLKQSGVDPTANKTLLDFLKNNPTLKSLGKVSDNVKELLTSLKKESNPLPIEKELNKFLTDIKDLKSADLKAKIENSGVFLESKLKNLESPKESLKKELEKLVKKLKKSDSPKAKKIVAKAVEILKSKSLKEISNTPTNKTLKENQQSLQTLKTSLKELIIVLERENSDADTIHTPKLDEALEKLEYTTSSKLLTPENFKLNSLSDALKEIQLPLMKSFKPEAKEILKNLNAILTTLKGIEESSKIEITPKQLETIKELQKSLEKVELPTTATTIEKEAQNSKILISMVENLKNELIKVSLTPTTFTLESLEESFEQIIQKEMKLFVPYEKEIFESLKNMFKTLRNIQKESISTKASLQKLKNTKSDVAITNLTQQIKTLIKKDDPIFSKEITQILNNLSTMNSLSKLENSSTIKELLSEDLKALLLMAQEQINNSTDLNSSNANEVLKHIDKLLVQIDYYQLLSSISDSSLLFLPFSWDNLEDGDIQIKKGSGDETFECDINLKLKEYGELNLKLILYDKNQLNLYIYSNSQEFKKLANEALPSLRSALIDTQITPRVVRVLELKKKSFTQNSNPYLDEFKMGFEVTV
ncbi:MAG: hypothetical protein GQ570_15290 [Helicobacteraceae bacterium]|nr:hypothetical protein [Helicobacteraceae bacterium]